MTFDGNYELTNRWKEMKRLAVLNTGKIRRYETKEMKTGSRVTSEIREPKVSDTVERYMVRHCRMKY